MLKNTHIYKGFGALCAVVLCFAQPGEAAAHDAGKHGHRYQHSAPQHKKHHKIKNKHYFHHRGQRYRVKQSRVISYGDQIEIIRYLADDGYRPRHRGWHERCDYLPENAAWRLLPRHVRARAPRGHQYVVMDGSVLLVEWQSKRVVDTIRLAFFG